MASQLLAQESTIRFLLSNDSKPQALHVLKTLTDKQTKSISEIFLNVLKGNFKGESVGKIKKYSNLIRRVGTQTYPNRKRKLVIQEESGKVLSILKNLKEEILEVLDEEGTSGRKLDRVNKENEEIRAGG